MKIVWLPAARADLKRHIDYTRQHSVSAARRIRARIIERIEALKEFPDAGTTIRSGMRHLVVTGTPYIVVFRREAKSVTIFAIYHGAQDRPM